MGAIILSKEQEKAVNYSYAGAFAIKGIAGSGKTTVGLHRIQFLLEKCYNGESILIVTYHKVLVNYLKHLYEKEKVDNYQIDFDLGKGKNYNIINIDSLVYDKYKDFRFRHLQSTHYKRLPERTSPAVSIKGVFVDKLKEIQKLYPVLEILTNSNLEFLRDEVDYINNCRIETVKEYQVFTRNGRNRFSDNRKNLAKKSKEREAIFFLRRKYNNELVKSGLMDFPVMRHLALREVIENPPKKYTHLIIDECQDMDKTRMDFIKHFIEDSPSASATFLYDNTQSIYKESWLGNNHSFNSLGIDIKGRSKILKKNFRTTYEIQEAAQSLLTGSQLIKQEIEPILINRSGTKPFWAHCESFTHQIEYICDVIKTHSDNFELKDIIVAVRTNQEVFVINKALIDKGIHCGILSASDNSMAKNQVRVMTLHGSKGLESQVFIIANLNEGTIPFAKDSITNVVQELKLLYVGMTRASKHLYMTSFGTPSDFLKTIGHTTIEKIDFKSYQGYQPIEDPQIREKIKDILNRLEITIQNCPDFKSNVQTRSDFLVISQELIQYNHQLDKIHSELDQLNDKVQANTPTHSLFINLWNISAGKLKIAEQELINFINKPVDFKDIEFDIKERFFCFDVASVNSISNIEHHLKMAEINNESDSKDWGPYLTYYSKSIEIELKKVFAKYGFKLTKTNPHNNKFVPISLQEMFVELEIQGDRFSTISDMLNEVNFRRKRNIGTHENVIKLKDIWPIRETMMKKNGILDILNNLLE